MTHTSGVINAMTKQIDLEVFSNETLPEVRSEMEVIPPTMPNVPVFGELFYNLKVISRLKKTTSSVDFIYQRYSGESFSGAYLASRMNIPFVLEFNSSEVWKLQNWSRTTSPIKNFFKRFVQLPIVRRIEQYNLKKASLIVVVSDVLKDNLVQSGVAPSKILVNPNGVDVDRFQRNGENESLRDELNLGRSFVYGFIGTFGKWHGVVELAKATVRFYNERPDLKGKVKFLIIGSGKLYPQVEQIIRNADLDSDVILTGQIPQSKNTEYLSLCDAFLSPHIPNPDGTRFFGSPTKLFEYMACGKPVIASNLDQIGEILEHERTALLTVPGDIDHLVSTMIHLYENPQLQKTLGENAVQEVCKSYTWDVHVKRILTEVEKLKGNE